MGLFASIRGMRSQLTHLVSTIGARGVNSWLVLTKTMSFVALAYDSLHDELKARFIVDRSNAGGFGVRFHEYEAAQTSTLFAGTHARGANSFLWICGVGLCPVRRPAAQRRDSDRRPSERERRNYRRGDDMARWARRATFGIS